MFKSKYFYLLKFLFHKKTTIDCKLCTSNKLHLQHTIVFITLYCSTLQPPHLIIITINFNTNFICEQSEVKTHQSNGLSNLLDRSLCLPLLRVSLLRNGHVNQQWIMSDPSVHLAVQFKSSGFVFGVLLNTMRNFSNGRSISISGGAFGSYVGSGLPLTWYVRYPHLLMHLITAPVNQSFWVICLCMQLHSSPR